jgi:hypothetical protein
VGAIEGLGQRLPGGPDPLLQLLGKVFVSPFQEAAPVEGPGLVQAALGQGLLKEEGVAGYPGLQDLIPHDRHPGPLELGEGHGEAVLGVLRPGPEELLEVAAGLGALEGQKGRQEEGLFLVKRGPI